MTKHTQKESKYKEKTSQLNKLKQDLEHLNNRAEYLTKRKNNDLRRSIQGNQLKHQSLISL
jgi:hypothetical protein